MYDAEPISLRDLDIVMSYREGNEERRENLHAVLRHLTQTYADFRIWLMEADTEPRFDWRRINDPRVRHVFVHHAGPFPKSRLYNMGFRLSSSRVVCFHDADSIATPFHLRHAIDSLIDKGDCDVLCPYGSVINVQGEMKKAFVDSGRFDVFGPLDPDRLPSDANLIYASANGGIVFFRREVYLRLGGYDPRLEGWGGEDDELLMRASRLGYRWMSLQAPLVHLHHDVASRAEWIASTRESPNVKRAFAVRDMPIEEVEAIARELSALLAVAGPGTTL